jgi:cytochrome c556
LNIKQIKEKQMCKSLYAITAILLVCCASTSMAAEDSRQFVELPKMMQDHMMSNMRDHLASINEILQKMKNGELDKAAEVAESRLGMSSLELHGASHMAKFMPEGMREAGTNMHRAASRFALKAQEGEVLPAYKTLAEVTAACVTCHAAYRIR